MSFNVDVVRFKRYSLLAAKFATEEIRLAQMCFLVLLQTCLVTENLSAEFTREISRRWRIRIFLNHLGFRMRAPQMPDQMNQIGVVARTDGAFHFILAQSLDTLFVRRVVEIVAFDVSTHVILVGVPFAANVAFERSVIVFVMASHVQFQMSFICELQLAQLALVSRAIKERLRIVPDQVVFQRHLREADLSAQMTGRRSVGRRCIELRVSYDRIHGAFSFFVMYRHVR